MNEDRNTLDDRAAKAATDLRSRAESRPRPTFDPTHVPDLETPAAAAVTDPGAHRVRYLLAAAAVLVLVVAVGAAWFGTRSTDDGDPGPVTSTTDGPRPFVATGLPDGFTVQGAGEVTDGETGSGDGSEAPLVLYGAAADRPELGLTDFPDFDLSQIDEDAVSFEVDGTTVYASEQTGLAQRVVVAPRGDHAVFVLSPTLGRDELGALAVAATGSGDAVNIPAEALPSNWSEIGREPSLIGLSSPMSAGRGSSAPGALVAYGNDEQTVMITSSSGGEVRLNAVRLVLTDVEDTTVRGHQAIVGTSQPGGADDGALATTVVTWIERPGELIRVSGYGMDRQATLDLANGIRPAEGDEWRDLLERSKLGDFQPDGYLEDDDQVEVARGRFDDGLAWVVRVGADAGPGATPDLQVALSGDSSSGSSGTGTQISGPESEPTAMRGLTELDQAGRRFAAGFVGPEVERVEIRALDGTALATAEVIVGSGDGAAFRVWVAELPEGAAWAVGLRADGAEAGQETISGGGATEDTIPDPVGPTTVVSGSGSGTGSTGSSSGSGSSSDTGSAGN